MKNEKEKEIQTVVFGRTNYILVAVGIVLLVLGYILLSGGGSDDPNVFNPAMFDTRRLYIAPLFIVAGLIVEIVAILYKGKSKAQKED